MTWIYVCTPISKKEYINVWRLSFFPDCHADLKSKTFERDRIQDELERLKIAQNDALADLKTDYTKSLSEYEERKGELDNKFKVLCRHQLLEASYM